MHHSGSSSCKCGAFTLQLGSISCGAHHPREPQPVVEVRNCAVGTLNELWLTCCHGNSYSPTMGQQCVLSPCTTQTVRIKNLTIKVWAQQPAFIVSVMAKRTNTDELSGLLLIKVASFLLLQIKNCWTKKNSRIGTKRHPFANRWRYNKVIYE